MPKTVTIEDCLVEVAGACYCIAIADGHVAPEEVMAIATSLVRASGGTVAMKEALQLLKQTHAEVEKIGRDEYLWGLGQQLGADAKRQVLSSAALTMIADGEATDSERAVYLEIARGLGFDEADAEDLIHEVAQEQVQAQFAKKD